MHFAYVLRRSALLRRIVILVLWSPVRKELKADGICLDLCLNVRFHKGASSLCGSMSGCVYNSLTWGGVLLRPQNRWYMQPMRALVIITMFRNAVSVCTRQHLNRLSAQIVASPKATTNGNANPFEHRSGCCELVSETFIFSRVHTQMHTRQREWINWTWIYYIKS